MLWIPVAAFAVWLVIWRVKFSILENVTGLLGLLPDRVRGQCCSAAPGLVRLVHGQRASRSRSRESAATYWYFAIALFGAAMTPYEVFFFSSGAVEEQLDHQGSRQVPAQRVRRLPARRDCCRWRSRPARPMVLLPAGSR